MKQIIKLYFPFILAILCCIFTIRFFFQESADSPDNIFTKIGTSFLDFKQQNNQSTLPEQIAADSQETLPVLTYSGGSLTVGTSTYIEDLFYLSFSDGQSVSMADQTDAALYLDDIQNFNDQSVLTRLITSEIEELEELPSAVVYDTEEHLLYFHNSGIYRLYLRLFLNEGGNVLFQCNIPVEVS